MTKREVRAILIKSADGEHGSYVLKMFEDVFSDEKDDTIFETEDMDDFLKLAVDLASLKTKINASKNHPERKHDMFISFYYGSNPRAF